MEQTSKEQVWMEGERHTVNRTMRLEADLASVCNNLTEYSKDNVCDRFAMGISLSTPILMMSTGVLGNLLALIVLLTADRQARHTPFFPLLMGMACSDFIGQLATGTIAVMVYANNLRWVGGRVMCLCHGFAMVFFGVMTPLLVCSMSIERLLALRFSYFYQRCFTRRVAKSIIFGALLFTLFFCTWPLIGLGSYGLQFPGSWCFLNYHKQSFSDMIYALGFACLNIIIIVCIVLSNVTVVCTLLKMRRARPHMHSSLPAPCEAQTTRRPRSMLKLEIETQMVWFLSAFTIVFTCLWLPLNVHIFINQLTGEKDYKQDLITIRLASINQIIDPWMYMILRKKTFFNCLRHLKQLVTNTRTTKALIVPPRPVPSPETSQLTVRQQRFTSLGLHMLQHDVAAQNVETSHIVTNEVSCQPVLQPLHVSHSEEVEI